MSNRLVVFSDVQGNSVALQAMFDYTKNLPDADSLDYFCLGDVACGYAPNTVIDLLRENHVRSVRGNMDDVILNPVASEDDDSEKHFNEMDFWASEQLTPINRDYLVATPLRFDLQTHRINYTFLHGHLYDNKGAVDYNAYSLETYFPEGTNILFTGNTHVAFMVPADFDKTLLNPGSIGYPNYPTNGKRPLRAQFIIVDEGRFEFITINYKREDFSFAVMNSGMPHAIRYLGSWDI